MSLRALVVLFLVSAFAKPSAAQVGATTDIVTGTVVGPRGEPLSGATVEVTSLETDVTRRKTTNARGRGQFTAGQVATSPP